MPAPIIRVQYEILEDIVKRFEQQASDTDALTSSLFQKLSPLEGGSWKGAAAQKFFHEMNESIFPTTNRLYDALIEGSETTQQIIRVFQAAEEDAFAQFQTIANGNIPTNGTATDSLVIENDGAVVSTRGGPPPPPPPSRIIDDLNDAMDGWGTDEDAIFDLTANATDEEKQSILDDAKLMRRLDKELNRSDMLRVLRNLGAPVEDQLSEAMDGWGTHEGAIFEITANATAEQRQQILGNSELMERLDKELNRSDMLRVLRNLDAPIEDQMNEAMDGIGTDEDALFDISANATPAQRQQILDNRDLTDRLNSELNNSDLIRVLDNLDAPVQPVRRLNNNSSMATLYDSIEDSYGEDQFGSRRPIRVFQTGPNDFLVSIAGTDAVIDGPNNWLNAAITVHGLESNYVRRVRDIIRENIPQGANINLAGHSQGGHVAVELVDDQNLVNDFNINSITTFGSTFTNVTGSQINPRLGAERYNQFLISNDPFGILIPPDGNHIILPSEGNLGNSHMSYEDSTVLQNTALPFDIQQWDPVGAFG